MPEALILHFLEFVKSSLIVLSAKYRISNTHLTFTTPTPYKLMTIRLGDVAPDFTATTTQGEIHFHQWLGNSWGVLFSHPADFTPVCTTELGMTAKLKDEFSKRNVKVIAVSVDPVDSHHEWIKDINETQNTQVNFQSLRMTTERWLPCTI